ncbi:hypothetical protein NLU13_7822 [Sarocladium strictum]|uniref:DUF4470 domain-containing protein n=1 Tax=Sarocladium strictum TaxID=5046 RepID=A0AA39GE31_SARSR|nr:hypothetical protein NLU13_7822 [Sarocladium strictum]
MAKCHLHNLALQDAENAAAKLGSDGQSRALRSSIKELQTLWNMEPEEGTFRKHILDRFPRYKGVLRDDPEYYPMGHDDPISLYDEELKSKASGRTNVAFLLCGSGDARHLFVTMMGLSAFGAPRNRATGSKALKAHITILDINAASIAKTLIMFDMIMMYTILKTRKTPRIEDALTVMAYTYSSAFVPSFVVTKVLEHIRTLIDELEEAESSPGTTVLGFLYLPKDTRTQVLRKLKQWAAPLAAHHAVAKLRPVARDKFRFAQKSARELFGPKPSAKFLKQCRQEFEELGVLFAEQPFLQRRDPDLIPLIEAYRAKQPNAKKALEAYIDAEWKLNPTVIDLDHDVQLRAEAKGTGRPYEPYLEFNPLELVDHIGDLAGKRTTTDTGIGVAMRLFEMLALSTMMLIGRIQIEVIVGEMADVLERIRYGCLEHRSHKPSAPSDLDPTRFPNRYDRIAMSNIPDYIGGPLGSHLFGGPLLRDDDISNLRFNNLLNPPMFKNHDQFLAEYLLMTDPTQISNHFGLARQEGEAGGKTNEGHQALLKMLGPLEFYRENYFIWARSGIKRVPANQRMSRASLEHWLHSHLLKICIPYHRPVTSSSPVHAPLNLTIFLRLVIHMHEVGYPSHWLSGILHSICEGKITTRARFPRRLILEVGDLAHMHEPREISLGPWQTEFTTLLSLWRRLLPFGMIAPEKSLVPSTEIVECSITFGEFPHWGFRNPHTAMVFFDIRTLGLRDLMLPELIQDDEQGDASPFAAELRKGHVHLFTAFNYVTETRTATLWLRRDFVAEVMRGDWWGVGVCREEMWELVTPSIVSPATALRTLRTWAS